MSTLFRLCTVIDSGLWIFTCELWEVYRLWGTDLTRLGRWCIGVQWNRKKPRVSLASTVKGIERFNKPIWLKEFYLWSSFTLLDWPFYCYSFRPTMTDSSFTIVFHRNSGKSVKAVAYSPQSSCCYCCFVIFETCSLRNVYLKQTVNHHPLPGKNLIK